jgi:hypothetical protein
VTNSEHLEKRQVGVVSDDVDVPGAHTLLNVDQALSGRVRLTEQERDEGVHPRRGEEHGRVVGRHSDAEGMTTCPFWAKNSRYFERSSRAVIGRFMADLRLSFRAAAAVARCRQPPFGGGCWRAESSARALATTGTSRRDRGGDAELRRHGNKVTLPNAPVQAAQRLERRCTEAEEDPLRLLAERE